MNPTMTLLSLRSVSRVQFNEPYDNTDHVSLDDRAIKTMRQTSPEAATFPIYIHDAFNNDQYSAYAANRTDFVVVDHHSYFVFDKKDETQSATANTENVEDNVSTQLHNDSKTARGNEVIGEWSCALTPASLQNMTNKLVARQQFCQGQEQVYRNTTAGWHFWSYMMEDCDSDLDWCFKNAVGNTLPSSFFSYNSKPSTSPFKAAYIARSLAEMQMPSMTEVLQQPSPNASAVSDSDTTSSDSDATPTPSLSSRNIGSYHQRFLAIHSHKMVHRHKRAGNVTQSLTDLTATEQSITKGYSDGFLTAKIFAQYGFSELGFSIQYIQDSIKALGPEIIASGTEANYASWFHRGKADAESMIRSATSTL